MDVIRALKDVDYRLTLSAADQARLDHPAGPIELTDADLDTVGGMSLDTVCWCVTDYCTDYGFNQDQQAEFCTYGWRCQCTYNPDFC
jgi:mersacidin/lichenicidin family type 2 lantibiotic